ncbi:ArsR/SmtB family transcription factor [Angustibacter aerolatus]
MSDQRPDQPSGTAHLDARNLRGVAHPLRVRILGMLRSDGADTATGLANRLGLSSAATSYHLRQLAAYGFIVEDAERGQGRERWWRAAHRSTRMDDMAMAADPEASEASEQYLRGVTQVYAQRVQSAMDELPYLPPQWRGRGTLSDQELRLTPDEADRLAERLMAVLEEFRRSDEPDAPDDAERVVAQVLVFKRPGDGR